MSIGIAAKRTVAATFAIVSSLTRHVNQLLRLGLHLTPASDGSTPTGNRFRAGLPILATSDRCVDVVCADSAIGSQVRNLEPAGGASVSIVCRARCYEHKCDGAAGRDTGLRVFQTAMLTVYLRALRQFVMQSGKSGRD